MITENEIVRWLARLARASSTKVDLAKVSVRMVLKEKDSSLRGISIFCFAKLDTPIEDVMGRLSTERALEAILLTSSGRRDMPTEGIVTRWDAARYSAVSNPTES